MTSFFAAFSSLCQIEWNIVAQKTGFPTSTTLKISAKLVACRSWSANRPIVFRRMSMEPKLSILFKGRSPLLVACRLGLWRPFGYNTRRKTEYYSVPSLNCHESLKTAFEGCNVCCGGRWGISGCSCLRGLFYRWRWRLGFWWCRWREQRVACSIGTISMRLSK